MRRNINKYTLVMSSEWYNGDQSTRRPGKIATCISTPDKVPNKTIKYSLTTIPGFVPIMS